MFVCSSNYVHNSLQKISLIHPKLTLLPPTTSLPWPLSSLITLSAPSQSILNSAAVASSSSLSAAGFAGQSANERTSRFTQPCCFILLLNFFPLLSSPVLLLWVACGGKALSRLGPVRVELATPSQFSPEFRRSWFVRLVKSRRGLLSWGENNLLIIHSQSNVRHVWKFPWGRVDGFADQ